jgi:putative oxidoreductase
MRPAVTWILSVLLAVAFLGAGGSKLASHPMMIATFNGFGYPLWFMYVTGVIELTGAVLVLFPRLAYFGAALLTCVMVGAIVSHLTHGQAAKVPLPLILLVLALAVGTLRGWRAQPASQT